MDTRGKIMEHGTVYQLLIKYTEDFGGYEFEERWSERANALQAVSDYLGEKDIAQVIIRKITFEV